MNPGVAVPLAFGANFVLGVMLLALGAIIYRKSPDRSGRIPLTVFIGLVGLNYLIDGVANLALIAGIPPNDFRYAALLPIFIDPAALLLFALTLTQRTTTLAVRVGIFAPGSFLAALYVIDPPPLPFLATWSPSLISPVSGAIAYVAMMSLFYAAAYALLVHAYVTESRTIQRDRLAIHAIAFGVVILPRLALVPLDINIEGLSPRMLTQAAAILGVITAMAFALMRVTGRSTNRAHVARTMRALAALLVAVATIWSLTHVDVLRASTISLTFSFRWFLFVAVLAQGIRRYDLLNLAEPSARRIDGAFAGALATLVAIELAAVITALAEITIASALLASSLFVAVTTGVYLAIRRVLPATPTDLAWRRLALYRSHAELSEDESCLEEVRERLGIPEREARDIRALVAMEQDAREREPAIQLREGELILDRFEVQRFLGAGAFGRTFLANDRMLGEHVVLKELHRDWQRDPTALARFLEEAKSLMRVEHPNLVAFKSLERVAGGHILVLGHVAGQSLRDRLAHSPLTPVETASLVTDVLGALGAVHDAGVVHRDVKPENIIIAKDGRAILVDFGAAMQTRSGTRAYAPDDGTGTPGYMSPEQAEGRDVGPASDLFALAVTAWESVAREAYPRGDVPASMRPVLERALARDPADRWSDARAFKGAWVAATRR